MIIFKQAIAAGALDTVKISDLTNPATKIPLTRTLGTLLTSSGFNLLELIFVLIGLVFFANLIMVGWDYMLSSGDPKKIAAASSRITNGLIGLIMAVTAFVVVRTIASVLGIPGII